MLKIRPEQVAILEQYMIQQFENKMLVHLRNNFNDKIKSLTDNELRALIQFGIKQAKKYDIELEKDVQSYLEMMIIYDIDFDTHSKTAWAGEILRTQNVEGTMKMQLLEDYELNLLRKLT